MSQKLVYEILESLGGRATLRQIRDEARRKYPDRTLWQYVSQDMHSLKKWDYVDFDYSAKQWFIKSPAFEED